MASRTIAPVPCRCFRPAGTWLSCGSFCVLGVFEFFGFEPISPPSASVRRGICDSRCRSSFDDLTLSDSSLHARPSVAAFGRPCVPVVATPPGRIEGQPALQAKEVDPCSAPFSTTISTERPKQRRPFASLSVTISWRPICRLSTLTNSLLRWRPSSLQLGRTARLEARRSPPCPRTGGWQLPTGERQPLHRRTQWPDLQRDRRRLQGRPGPARHRRADREGHNGRRGIRHPSPRERGSFHLGDLHSGEASSLTLSRASTHSGYLPYSTRSVRPHDRHRERSAGINRHDQGGGQGSREVVRSVDAHVNWTHVRWQKPLRSNGSGNCWMLTRLPNVMIGVRDSKPGEESPVLQFTEAEWQAFRLGMADGEFDLLLRLTVGLHSVRKT
jgi:hypothetical protein